MIIFIDENNGKISYTKDEFRKLLEAARQDGILEGRRQILELQSMTYLQTGTHKKQDLEVKSFYTPEVICSTDKQGE